MRNRADVVIKRYYNDIQFYNLVNALYSYVTRANLPAQYFLDITLMVYLKIFSNYTKDINLARRNITQGKWVIDT